MGGREAYYEVFPESDLERGPSNPAVPERNLIAEVLARAIRDVLNDLKSQQSKNDKRSAITWLRLDRVLTKKSYKKDSKTPFTFIWCCITLDLSPYTMRERISYLRDNGIKIEI